MGPVRTHALAYPTASASPAIGMSSYCAAASATNDASTDTHDSELRAWQIKYSELNMNVILGAPEEAPVCRAECRYSVCTTP